jgi:AraC-like DNA-binding protein
MFWYYSGQGPAHRCERVLPDGSAELVINLDDIPRKRFDPVDSRRFQTVRRAWISGPQPEFILIDVLPQATMVGVHFKPGGLAPFAGLPVGELAGHVVELESLWGPAAQDLRDNLLEAPLIEDKFNCLQSFLEERMQRRARPIDVAAALGQFLQEPGSSIATVARKLGVSHKHLIHCFRTEVGLSPKQFCRIRRFQTALANLQTKPEVDWADFACATGYYDQSHLIHDFQTLSGLTPSRYLRQSGADTRFVPVTDERETPARARPSR